MTRPRLVTILSLAVSILIVAMIFNRAGDKVAFVENTRLLMGTIVQIKVSVKSANERLKAEEALVKAFAEMARVEGVFSTFKVDSEVSKINRSAGEGPVTTTGEVVGLIERSIFYSEKTDGAFDITVKPLIDLWRRANVSQKMPSEERLKSALDKVGRRFVIIDKASGTVKFAKYGMAIDLGGIAKGYAVKRAADVLSGNDIRNFIISAGGDMYCAGTRSKKELWKIGLRHPRDKGKILFEIKLRDRAVETSGDYERYFTLNGKRYSHIIDPRTGQPIGDNVVSATVISVDPVMGDALSTALCILGARGLDMIRSLGDIDAMIIYRKGKILGIKMSEGFEKRYDIKKK
jgi:thiamine biosynthesis lipoprotein